MGALRTKSVYAFGRYNVLLVTPPLTITRDEFEQGIAALDEVLGRVDLIC